MPRKLCFETDSWTTISRAKSVNLKVNFELCPNWDQIESEARPLMMPVDCWLLMGQNQAMVFIHQHWSQSNVNTPSFIWLWNHNGSHFDLMHTSWLISGRRKKVPYFVQIFCWSKKIKSWCLSTNIGPSIPFWSFILLCSLLKTVHIICLISERKDKFLALCWSNKTKQFTQFKTRCIDAFRSLTLK